MFAFLKILLFVSAAIVLNTLKVSFLNWQYWAIMIIMFVSVISAAIEAAQHRVQRIDGGQGYKKITCVKCGHINRFVLLEPINR